MSGGRQAEVLRIGREIDGDGNASDEKGFSCPINPYKGLV